MAGTKSAQAFLSIEELVRATQQRHSKQWKWEDVGADGLDVLIRPRTTDEAAAALQEGMRLDAAREQFLGTADEPDAIETYRYRLRHAIPCILDPHTGNALFAEGDVEQLLRLPVPTLNAILNEVDTVGNLTKAAAAEQEKNSEETGANSTSSVSPSEPATPTSSPTPMR